VVIIIRQGVSVFPRLRHNRFGPKEFTAKASTLGKTKMGGGEGVLPSRGGYTLSPEHGSGVHPLAQKLLGRFVCFAFEWIQPPGLPRRTYSGPRVFWSNSTIAFNQRRRLPHSPESPRKKSEDAVPSSDAETGLSWPLQLKLPMTAPVVVVGGAVFPPASPHGYGFPMGRSRADRRAVFGGPFNVAKNALAQGCIGVYMETKRAARELPMFAARPSAAFGRFAGLALPRETNGAASAKP